MPLCRRLCHRTLDAWAPNGTRKGKVGMHVCLRVVFTRATAFLVTPFSCLAGILPSIAPDKHLRLVSKQPRFQRCSRCNLGEASI
jgi:hypothetical protein